MSQYHVLIPDNVDQQAIERLEALDEIHVSSPGKLSQEDLIAQIAEAHGIIIRSGVKITADVLAAAPNLKAIARAGVGVHNVDLDAATAKGVYVMNTPGGNTIATAEHTFGLMLALARHIPQGNQSLKDGRWDRKLYKGVELRGKTLGVIGFGRIGRAVAIRAKAFEMHVLAYDPYVNVGDFEEFGIEKVDLNTLYARSDFITLHTAISEETTGMINAAAISRMKPGVRLINAARGALINDTDLAEGIQTGKIAGAALDVYAEEPPPADHPLIGLDNVIDTPHLAASTVEAQVAVAVEAADLLVAALLHDKPQNVVNKAVLG